MKITTKYVCSECGYESARWLGKCLSCGTFGTMVEETVTEAPKPKSKSAPTFQPATSPKAVKISEVQSEDMPRVKTNLTELDNVLGGGIVRGSLVLIGGDPGIGKSTILTQVMLDLADKHNVLYVSAEESVSQVKLRADRLRKKPSDMHIVTCTELEQIEEILNQNDYEFIVIDSIQAIYLSALSASSGSVSQVRECASRLMRIAKTSGCTIFIIGHVTKEGNIAGPKVLEHIMDTVLYFEGESSSTFKILRAVKNRFGRANEVGIFDMQDSGIVEVNSPSQILLSDTRGDVAGSAVCPVIEGSRCILIEIQALISPTVFGMPRRMSGGVDYNKFVLLLAVLEKKAGISLYNQDAYLNIMGGIRANEPAIDLAVLLAVISAHKNVPIPKDTAILGEASLTGEVRAVRDISKRINECIKMGFKRIILPSSNLKNLPHELSQKIELVGIKYIWELKKIMS